MAQKTPAKDNNAVDEGRATRARARVSNALYFLILLMVLSAAFGAFIYFSCQADAFGDYRYSVCKPVMNQVQTLK